MNKEINVCVKRITVVLCLVLTVMAVFPLFSCVEPEEDDDDFIASIPEDAWYNPDNGFVPFNEGLTVRISLDTRGTDLSADAEIDSAAKYLQGPSEIGSDDVQNLCYVRNRAASVILGLSIDYAVEPKGLSSTQIAQELEKHALLSKAPFDLVISDIYPVTSIALKGQLYNVMSDYGTPRNYFDFNHESWYLDYMLGTTIDAQKVYCVAGDYFMDVLRSANCIYVNTKYFNEICTTIGFDSIDDFYTLIAEGDWTYDEFRSLIAAAWRPSGTSGVTTKEDGIGLLICIDNALHSFAYTAGFSMLKKQGNTYCLEESVSTLQSFAEAIYSITDKTNGVLYTKRTDFDSFRSPFVEGKVLFLGGYWIGDLEHSSFHEMEEKAPIVYPKWNETLQGYKTYVHHSAEVGYILKNTRSFTETSAYLQYLSEESTEIIERYYEFAIKYKYNTDPKALEMLDIIHDTISPAFDEMIAGQLECDLRTLLDEMRIQHGAPEAAQTKYLINRDTVFQKRLETLIHSFDKLD